MEGLYFPEPFYKAVSSIWIPLDIGRTPPELFSRSFHVISLFICVPFAYALVMFLKKCYHDQSRLNNAEHFRENLNEISIRGLPESSSFSYHLPGEICVNLSCVVWLESRLTSGHLTDHSRRLSTSCSEGGACT